MKLLPVIHIESVEQAIRNALLAKECKAHGCFLIHHEGNREELLETYVSVKKAVGNWWVGLNDLSRNGMDLLNGLPEVDGLWVDSIDYNQDVKPNFSGLFFGGVAFKYQKKVSNVGKAAREAKAYCDVVTTSGDKTGMAPDLDKIILIKESIGSTPLAVASGITPENVQIFLPYVDYFLVATGISFNFYELDPNRIKTLLSEIKNFEFSSSKKRLNNFMDLERDFPESLQEQPLDVLTLHLFRLLCLHHKKLTENNMSYSDEEVLLMDDMEKKKAIEKVNTVLGIKNE